MPKLPSTQDSPRGPQSISGAVGLLFEERWLARNEGCEMVRSGRAQLIGGGSDIASDAVERRLGP